MFEAKKKKSGSKALGKKRMRKTGDPNSESYLIQRVSMAIQKGNAASLHFLMVCCRGT